MLRSRLLQREAVLQIGFTTSEVDERTDLRPLNLVFVIDKSGSMADDDKMSRVKDSLRNMIHKLRSNDIVSIVAFDTNAYVAFPARPIGNGDELRVCHRLPLARWFDKHSRRLDARLRGSEEELQRRRDEPCDSA